MGEVWMAEQREPVKRQVAVKLIKPGMASDGMMRRFEAERQALALMDFHAKDPAKAAEWRAKLPREFAPMPRKKIEIEKLTIDDIWKRLDAKK